MTNSPQEQLHVSHHSDSDATQTSKKSSKFRKFLGVSKSESKVNSKSLSEPLTQALSQQSSIPQVNDRRDKPLPVALTMSQPHSDTFFLENVPSLAVRAELPRLQQRIKRTDQLIYCNALLLQDMACPLPAPADSDEASDDPTNAVQDSRFNKTEQDWLKEIKQDPMEQDHLQWLVTRMVEHFIQEAHKDSTEIAEIGT
ncbi:hypothetical protein EC991_004041 [Linnemannia zychae]|nr:hypothetical protein EC991_004041 [Linnemannia zychae]